MKIHLKLNKLVLPILCCSLFPQAQAVTCSGGGQVCNNSLVVPINLSSAHEYKVSFTASSGHCSDIKATVSAGSAVLGSSGFLGPGQSTGIFPIPNNATSVAVSAQGRYGGCNYGTLGVWTGSVNIYSSKQTCKDGYQKGHYDCSQQRVTPKESGQAQCPSGNPINTANGNKYQVENDINGQISVIRTYNSNLGYWLFSFRQNLIIIDENTLLIERSDGKTERFTKGDNSRWASDEDVQTTLQAINEENKPAKWIVTRPGQSVEKYDEKGRLLSIVYASGERYSLSYKGDDILIQDLRKNKLVYTVEHGVSVVKAVLNDGPVYEYLYDEKHRLAKVKRGDVFIRQYHYENEKFPFHLTGLTDANGQRYATWRYDDQGRGISSEHAEGIDKTTFSYSENATTVTNPLGKKTTYFFENFYGVKKVVRVEGQATANCLAANQEYTYYDNGLLKSKTDWKGVTTAFEYNNRGLETLRTIAVGTPSEYTIKTEWHDTLEVPTAQEAQGKRVEFKYDDHSNLIQRKEIELN
ncbi:RHS repeat protein [Zooshikella ganghwensis]|uniref:RHS repeat protein n=1 Tax=Zooshikella ganghwensis TaxID=202772 RepID=UPI00040A5DBF|nr:RHS repeat protein [Zooshikella ganghwensis]